MAGVPAKKKTLTPIQLFFQVKKTLIITYLFIKHFKI